MMMLTRGIILSLPISWRKSSSDRVAERASGLASMRVTKVARRRSAAHGVLNQFCPELRLGLGEAALQIRTCRFDRRAASTFVVQKHQDRAAQIFWPATARRPRTLHVVEIERYIGANMNGGNAHRRCFEGRARGRVEENFRTRQPRGCAALDEVDMAAVDEF